MIVPCNCGEEVQAVAATAAAAPRIIRLVRHFRCTRPNTASGSEGSATLTDAQAADLMAGKYYVNIHTEANKGGEIRGQVTK